MRAPASGSATERELPDVLSGDGETFDAIEAKSSAGDPIYLTGEEVEALRFRPELRREAAYRRPVRPRGLVPLPAGRPRNDRRRQLPCQEGEGPLRRDRLRRVRG